MFKKNLQSATAHWGSTPHQITRLEKALELLGLDEEIAALISNDYNFEKIGTTSLINFFRKLEPDNVIMIAKFLIKLSNYD